MTEGNEVAGSKYSERLQARNTRMNAPETSLKTAKVPFNVVHRVPAQAIESLFADRPQVTYG